MSAEVIAEGDTAPGFTLDDQAGKPVSLADFAGTRVVLYFYPRADTPGCTTQACGIRDRAADYAKAGVKVLGISPDPVDDIAGFAAKNDLAFTLLADPDHEVAEAYGTWVEKSMYGRKYMGMERSTFLVGADGRIAKAWRKVSVTGHAAAVLKAAQAL